MLLIVFATGLVVQRTLDGLAGAIIGSVCSYWLPTTTRSLDQSAGG